MNQLNDTVTSAKARQNDHRQIVKNKKISISSKHIYPQNSDIISSVNISTFIIYIFYSDIELVWPHARLGESIQSLLANDFTSDDRRAIRGAPPL